MHHLRGFLVLIAALLIGGLPIVRHADGMGWVHDLEGPLLIPQTWRLYGTGPRIRRVFEVYADDELLYRSADPEHTWRRATFTYRRVRPIVVQVCMTKSRNREPFLDWVGQLVKRDRPDVARIVMRCTVGPWPGGNEEEKVRYEATAPSFTKWRRP